MRAVNARPAMGWHVYSPSGSAGTSYSGAGAFMASVKLRPKAWNAAPILRASAVSRRAMIRSTWISQMHK